MNNRRGQAALLIIKRFWVSMLLVGMLLGLCSCGKNDPFGNRSEETGVSRDNSGLCITVFDVGKADAILVEAEENTILIDTGEDADQGKLLKELEKRDIRYLDYLLITHFDKDHLGSADEILSELSVGTILIPDYVGEGQTWRDFIAVLESVDAESMGNVQRIAAMAEIRLPGKEEITWVIYPAEDPQALINKAQAKDKEYDNEMSLVSMLTYGECRFLFAADVEGKRLTQMLDAGTDWSADWIKLPHHGDYSKKLRNLLEATGAGYGIVSTSKQEPTEEKLISALKELKIELYETTKGDIVTMCDGVSIEVTVKK